MISRVIKSSLSLATKSMSFQGLGSYQFSEKTWKDRDEAAEKVYITQTESNRFYQSRTSNEEAVGEDARRGIRQQGQT